MPAPPSYVGETCRCGHGLPPLSRAGRYRGLCVEGKADAVAAWRAKRDQEKAMAAGEIEAADMRARAAMNGDDGVGRPVKVRLAKVCEELVPLAERLEEALDERYVATVRAKAVLGEFKEGLRAVERVAQSLLNRDAIRREPKASG